MNGPSLEYIERFRRTLRITNTSFDGEIEDLIGAAREDLILAGVDSEKAYDEDDALIRMAVATYIKAEFGFETDNADKYRESYWDQKVRLLYADEYLAGKD